MVLETIAEVKVNNSVSAGEHDNFVYDFTTYVADRSNKTEMITMPKQLSEVYTKRSSKEGTWANLVVETTKYIRDIRNAYRPSLKQSFEWRSLAVDRMTGSGTYGTIYPLMQEVLHLHFDGSTFVDTSDNPKTLTVNGTAADCFLDTSQSKFGSSSARFRNSTGHLETGLDTAGEFWLYSDSFTIEWWEYRTDSSSGKSAIMFDPTGSNTGNGYSPFLCGYSNGTNLYFYSSSNGTAWDIINAMSMGPITLNTWNHFAIVRSVDKFYTFKNGTLISSSASWSTPMWGRGKVLIGGYAYSGWPTSNRFIGWMDEVIITKGIAKWTANFAVPTAATPDTFRFRPDRAMAFVNDKNPNNLKALPNVDFEHQSGVKYSLTRLYDTMGYTTTASASVFTTYQNPTQWLQQEAFEKQVSYAYIPDFMANGASAEAYINSQWTPPLQPQISEIILEMRPVVGNWADILIIGDSPVKIESTSERYGLELSQDGKSLQGVVAFSQPRMIICKMTDGTRINLNIIPTYVERLM